MIATSFLHSLVIQPTGWWTIVPQLVVTGVIGGCTLWIADRANSFVRQRRKSIKLLLMLEIEAALADCHTFWEREIQPASGSFIVVDCGPGEEYQYLINAMHYQPLITLPYWGSRDSNVVDALKKQEIQEIFALESKFLRYLDAQRSLTERWNTLVQTTPLSASPQELFAKIARAKDLEPTQAQHERVAASTELLKLLDPVRPIYQQCRIAAEVLHTLANPLK